MIIILMLHVEFVYITFTQLWTFLRIHHYVICSHISLQTINEMRVPIHGLQSLPPSPKRAERKGRRRPFREAGSGHKQWNTVSCVDTFSIISKFSAQNSKI